MFRLSKLTDYAVVVLIRLAAVDGVQTSPGVAQATGVPRTHRRQGAEGAVRRRSRRIPARRPAAATA